MLTLNDEQLHAVNIDHNCVVIAGAGAGKTTVLASRVLRLMAKNQVPLHKILLLTFTRKATAEITERVHSLLDECIKSAQYLTTPLDEAQVEFLRTQQENIQLAQIFTIDAFSFRIAQIGINRLGHLGALEISQSLMSDIQMFVEKWLMSHQKNKLKNALMYMPFGTLVEKVICPLLEKSSCFSCDLEKQLTNIILETKDKLHGVRSDILQTIDEMCETLKTSGARMNQGAVGTLVTSLTDTSIFLKDDTNSHECPQFVISLRGVTSTKEIKPIADTIKESKELLSAQLDTLCCYTSTLAHEAYYRDMYSALQEIVDDWNEYRHAKKIYSYQNIAEIAQHTLKEFDDVRKWYSARYEHIIIDEFQDNNLDQKMLLYLLSGLPTNKIGVDPLPHKYFFVGDPKQSIYSFRGADIHSFLSLKQDNQQLYMSANFRSNAQLIEMYNVWFKELFEDRELNTPITSSNTFSQTQLNQERVTYDEQRYPRDTPSSAEPPITMMLKDEELDALKRKKDTSATLLDSQCVLVECIDEDKKHKNKAYEKMELQGFVIAQRIRVMCKNGVQAHDIAVITRAKSILLYVARFLFEFNIPYTLEDSLVSLRKDVGRDFFSWLSLLLYPEDRGAYASVLRSPLCGISDNTVLALLHEQRRTDEHVVFCTKDIENTKHESVLEDLGALESIRKKYLEARTYISEGTLLKVLYHFWIDCGYRYVLLRNKKYHVFLPQFDSLKALIIAIGENGVVSFVDTLQSIIAGEKTDISLSQTHKDSGVQLMSIHKAKGLEFPYVILANIGAEILRAANTRTRCVERGGNTYVNLESSSNTHYLLDSKFRGSTKKNYTVFPKTIQYVHMQDIAELLRMLYVAMTRAEKGLVLTGFFDESKGKQMTYLSWLWNKKLIPFLPESARASSYDGIATNTHCVSILCPRPRVSEDILQYEKDAQTVATRADHTQDKISTELAHAKVIATQSNRVEYSPSKGKHLEPDFHETSLPRLEVDKVLKKHRAHIAFGTYCHFLLNNYCNNREPGFMPGQLESQLLPFTSIEQQLFISDATRLCHQFLQTPLWKEKTHSAKVYTEHPFLMWNSTHNIWIRGIIDLLIIDGDTYTIIDYKVDSFQNPQKYHYQLATYTLSVEKMYQARAHGNKVRSYLYYLRSGHEVPCDITKLKDEDAIIEYLKKTKDNDIEISDTEQ